MNEHSNSRIYASLLGVGLIALLLGNPQSSIRSQNATSLKSKNSTTNDCGNNIWYGHFLNQESQMYEYRQLDMSSGYTEAMLYGNDYYLVIYVKDVRNNMVGITIPVNDTFTFGVREGELRRGQE